MAKIIKTYGEIKKSEQLAVKLDSLSATPLAEVKGAILKPTGRAILYENKNASEEEYRGILVDTLDEGFISVSGDVAIDGTIELMEELTNEPSLLDEINISYISKKSRNIGDNGSNLSYNQLTIC